MPVPFMPLIAHWTFHLSQKDKQSGEYTVSYPVLGTPPDAVAVPTHFFKVILGKKPNGKFTITGFILPNRAIPENKDLRDFIAPVDVIEKYSGLLFFDKVRDQTELLRMRRPHS